MRRRFIFVFLLGVCGALAVTTSSAGTASAARDIGTVPAVLSPTTAVTLASVKDKSRYKGLGVTSWILTGRVTPAQAVPIEIWFKRFDQTAFSLASTGATTADGSFSTKSIGVGIKTAFQLRVPATPETSNIVTSNVVTLNSSPTVTITGSAERGTGSTKRGRFAVVVATAGYKEFDLSGKFVLVQRATSLGRWVTLRRVTLRRPPGAQSFGVVSASFSLSLPQGLSKMRAHLPATQAAPAYLASTSPTIIVG